MSEPIVSVQGIRYAFDGDPPLIDNLSFEIGAGEFTALLAPSGTGKSTVFRLIAGLLEPQAGSIEIGGAAGAAEDAAAAGRTNDGGSVAGSAAAGRANDGAALQPGRRGRPHDRRLGRVGYMPQRDCLMPWRTVVDNAALGLELQGIAKREARARVLDLLPSFGLAGTERKLPRELSGGMRQRVSFLRTLLGGTDVLLLDEPFSALDAMTRIEMQEWLLGIWERHRKTILFITHDIDEALLLSDRVLAASEAPLRRLHDVRVTLPRPRTYGVTTEPAFAALKRELLGHLRGGRSDGAPKGGGPDA